MLVLEQHDIFLVAEDVVAEHALDLLLGVFCILPVF